MSTSAKVLFDSLVGTESILDFVSQSKPETDWLDFKGCQDKRRESADISDKDIKKIWSKALSGFANSGGGVLVWGVDARPGDDSVDCAQEIVPHSNAARLRSRLIELAHDATDPPIMGLEFKEFLAPGESTAGFVVAYIPQGIDSPYRAELADKQYYIRSGDSFHPAGRSLLRTLFYPRTQSKLSPYFLFKRADRQACHESNGRNHPCKAIGFVANLRIVNLGTATAVDPCVRASGSGLFHEQFRQITSEWKTTRDGFLRLDDPIHPNGFVSLTEPSDILLWKTGEPEWKVTMIDPTEEICGEIRVYVRDSEIRAYRFRMSCGEIYDRLEEAKPRRIDFEEIDSFA